jgi:hypothetical protein
MGRPLVGREGLGDARVECLLDGAEVLVEDAEGDDQEEGEKEGWRRCAFGRRCVNGLGVPWCV